MLAEFFDVGVNGMPPTKTAHFTVAVHAPATSRTKK